MQNAHLGALRGKNPARSYFFLDLGAVAPKSKSGTRTISMRRFCSRCSAVSFSTRGENLPYPAPERLCSFTPLSMRSFTTARARADESSQFEGKREVEMGTLSVCPSTWKIG